MQIRLPALADKLAELASAEEDCQAANVDENDYTVFTFQDLEFEHGLVVQSISKKIAFIDNQVCSADSVTPRATNLTTLDRITQHDEPNTSTTRAIREYIPLLR